jgi:hypothetical protein
MGKGFIALARGGSTVVEHLPQHPKDFSQIAAAGSSGSTVVEHEPIYHKVEGLRPTAMT